MLPFNEMGMHEGERDYKGEFKMKGLQSPLIHY